LLFNLHQILSSILGKSLVLILGWVYLPENPIRGGFMSIPVTTGQTIPGKEIDSVLGLIFGAGTVTFQLKGNSGRAGSALEKAEEALAQEAQAVGANGVIGVQISMDSSGSGLSRSQTITLLGTAVKTK
jgi:uncharacterized protein YbjQ (UPF0145 family)